MFQIGAGELLAILIIALLVFGPDRLPAIAREVGRALWEFRRLTSQATEELTREWETVAKAAHEAEPSVAESNQPEAAKDR